MKLAEIDWGEVLDTLPRWEALSPDARKAFLRIKPATPAEPSVLGPSRDEMVAAGVVTPPGPKGRLYTLAPELRTLLKALRAAARLQPLDGPGGRLHEEYVQDQLTVEELRAFTRHTSSYYGSADRREAASRVSSVEWIRGFLDAEPGTPMVFWEQNLVVPGERQRLVPPALARATHALVRALADRAGGVPLRTLPSLLPEVDLATRVAALAAALRYLLVFVSVHDDKRVEAMLGVLPSIARRMGPPPPPPAAVAATGAMEAPFLVADMTAVLVEAAGEPIPVRGDDGSLYVRSQRAIAPRLLQMPAWMDAFLAGSANPARYEAGEEKDARLFDRIETAVAALTTLKLAKVERGERSQLAVTHAGRAWLALDEGERLKRLLDGLRDSPQLNPGWHQVRKGLDFFGVSISFGLGEEVDLRAPLAAAFTSAPGEGMVPLAHFTRYHAECRNPLLALGQGQARRMYG
ncbi:MAG TPA: hypothetical protein VFJ16_12670, partial [Longimicrobium sp.]|nr:hypothetical protein [Longimicrobium sp.]